jgi:type I restriction enzyme S subunit
MSWPVVKLSSVAEINPRRPAIERNDEAQTSFVPMEVVDDVRGEVVLRITQPFSKVKKGYTYFENGDVIFAKITPCMQNGKHSVLYNLEDGFGFGSTEFHVIRAGDEISPEWIHAFLRRKETLDAAVKTFTGTVGQQRVPTSFLQNLELPLPPIEKQRQIAADLKALLAEVDKARQAAETQLRDADILGQRIFNKIWAELDSVPRKPLGDYAQTTSGSTPARSNKQYWQPAEIAWVKTAEVAFAPITKTEEAISQKALAECSLTLLPPKTVLIAMYGQGKTRGQSAILEIPATTNQACFAVLPNDTWEPEFLFHWLKFSYQDLRTLSEGRGGNQANLNGGLLKALQIPTPDKPTQKAIIARIAYMLTEIEAVKNRSMSMFNDINLLPQKILAQAFQSIPE